MRYLATMLAMCAGCGVEPGPFPEVVQINNGHACSAVAISATAAQTAAHCVDDSAEVLVYVNDNALTAKVTWRDFALDLATITLPSPTFTHYAEPYTGPLHADQALLQVGYGCHTKVREATFVGVTWDDLVITSAETCPGDSGGGVFTPEGQLVSTILARSTTEAVGYSRSF